MKQNIANVARKISKEIEIIYKSSFCLSVSSLRTLSYSLVYPYLISCLSVWASTYPTNLNRIVILQKKVIRFISKKPLNAHTDPVFKEFQILKFANIYLFQIRKLLYYYKTGFLPGVFNEMFSINNQVHLYNARKSNTFYLFPARTTILQFPTSKYSKCCLYFSF